MRLLGPFNSGVGAGGAGAATNNYTTTTRVNGKVMGVYVRYNDAPPNTTDVIVKTVGTSPSIPTQTFLTLTNKNTDGLFMPRAIPQDTVGANLAALTVAEPVAIYDYVNVLIKEANDGDSVDVWLLLQ
jgi:hypothetical protein